MVLVSRSSKFLALSLLSVLSSSYETGANGSSYDYVIVGGGTAGMVVASRLSENPDHSVLVLEAGNFEEHNPNVTTITALGAAQGTHVDWQYQSIPQVSTNNRTITWRAGRGLGGSSLINGKKSGMDPLIPC